MRESLKAKFSSINLTDAMLGAGARELCQFNAATNPRGAAKRVFRAMAQAYIADTSTRERSFEDRYTPEPMSGCWLWLDSCDPTGYGTMLHDGKKQYAHRVSWILQNGPIPPGLHVLHKCDTPSCVNPDHLFAGTALENARDRDAKGRGHRSLRVCSN